MATSTISGVILDSAGGYIENVKVTATINPRPAFLTINGSGISATQETTTASDGTYSFTLTDTADITPDDSYYTIIEHLSPRHGGAIKYAIQVAGDATVYASLVNGLPAPGGPVVLTQAAGDARYLQLDGGMGESTDMVQSFPNDTAVEGVVNAAARIDHVHPRETVYGTDAERLALTGDDLYPGKVFRTTNLNQRFYVRRKDGLGDYNWYEQSDHWRVADATARDALPDPNEGSLIWQADTDELWVCYGSGTEQRVQIATTALTSHTPTLSQGASSNITKTVTYSQYRVVSGVCEWWFNIAVTGAGSAGSGIQLSLPVTASSSGFSIGAGIYYDASAPLVYAGTLELASTTLVSIHSTSSTGGYVGQTPSIATANTDAFRGYARYPVTTV